MRQAYGADDIMEWVAKVPWWVGVALAVGSYLYLHSLTGVPSVVAVKPGQVMVNVPQAMMSSLARIGQYVVPVVCLCVAITSFWQRRHKKELEDEIDTQIRLARASSPGAMKPEPGPESLSRAESELSLPEKG